jgi:hypothetical protein
LGLSKLKLKLSNATNSTGSGNSSGAANDTTAEDVAAEADESKANILKIFARDKVDKVVVNYNSVLNNTKK